jgi:hypothetical protein
MTKLYAEVLNRHWTILGQVRMDCGELSLQKTEYINPPNPSSDGISYTL